MRCSPYWLKKRNHISFCSRLPPVYTVIVHAPAGTPSNSNRPSASATAVYGVDAAKIDAAIAGWMSQPTR